MTDAAPTPSPPSAVVDFVAGTVAGIASLLTGHPFDTVKTRLQAQPVMPGIPTSSISTRSSLAGPSTALLTAAHDTQPHVPSSLIASRHGPPPIYSSATHAFRLIVKEERIAGLYKGVTSPMLGVAVMNASIFGLYQMSLQFQQRHGLFGSSSVESVPSLTQIMVAGMMSGLGSSLITSPIDLIKIREQMQVETRPGARPSTYRVFLDVLRNEGVRRGLYRGWCTTAIRDLGYGPYFFSYELINRQIAKRTGNAPTNLDMAVSGACAGVLAWLSTFWADVIKTKIQASKYTPPTSGSCPRFKGRSMFWSTASQTFAQGGWRAFFVGVGPTVLRALPVNAVLFVTFETTKDFLIQRGY